MAGQAEYNTSIQFKTIHLLKDQALGFGSYGKVCKAKCDDLLCAAKLIHETLLIDRKANQLRVPRLQREHRLPMRRFEQECDFLSTIRHPNIVQYLGIYQDPDNGLPALLMELMDDSLTHFLESSTQPIPYHIQVNICHDITLALSFLHSNSIVHRDLSSNNVLLIGNAIRTKVTDFGMARLGDQTLRASHISLTECPGTDVYMPPEAAQDKPVYTEKIDCFSFGVIILQILTKDFPKPENRWKVIKINQKGVPAGTVAKMLVPETERRQNHISIIDPNHTLLQVSLDCLKDRDVEHPSAQQLCERVAALKESPEYSGSVRATRESLAAEQHKNEEREKELRSLRQQIQEQQQLILLQDMQLEEYSQNVKLKTDTIASTRQQIHLQQSEIGRLERKSNELIMEIKNRESELKQQYYENQQLERDKNEATVNQRQAEAEKNEIIEEKERELGHMKYQLEECEQVIDQFQRRIVELEQLRPATDAPPRSKQQSSKAKIKMTWREVGKAPCKMSSRYNAIACGTAMYVRGRNQSVYTLNTSTSSWSQLPDSQTYNCPSVFVNNLLTLVGGLRGLAATNQLYSLTGEGSGRRWTEEFPPMPTKRYGSTALCARTSLIIAGGMGEDRSVLQTVEVMNTETLQWSTAAQLPQRLLCAPGAVCGDHIFILSVEGRSKSMYTCPVGALFQSCSTTPTADVWNKVAAPPVTQTACLTILGRLLTVGGRNLRDELTTAVHMYDPDSDSWEVISHMATARCQCLAAVLSDGELLVVGGVTGLDVTDSVEVATVER